MKQYISVIIDNQELVFIEVEGYGTPFIDAANRTLIPLRKPLEAIGAQVSYDENSRVVTASKNEITLRIPIGGNAITVNDREVIMDTEAVIKEGRTYIPLRAVFSAFGYDVEWHSSSKTIYLNEWD